MTGVNPLYFIVGMALLGLAPFFLMMVTSYVKIVVVTSLVRNALGVQQVPPAMVMNGLAIILSLFIMAPMMMSTMDIAEKLQISAEPSPKEVIGIVDKLTKDPAELMLMGAKARALAQPDSLDKICENLDQLMKTTA
mgnify:CR=1 FL=1